MPKRQLKDPLVIAQLEKKVVELYTSGLSINKITKIVGWSCTVIRKIIHKFDIARGKNTYDVDLHYFDVIDTPEKAYYLGFWYADGCVGDGKIRLQLADKEIIDSAKEVLKYTGPIYEIPPSQPGRKIQYCLCIARKELQEKLILKGCSLNKSLIITFPSEDMVPKKLLQHFIRGWFDGDGNIYYNKNQNRWKLQPVGTREFLEGVREIVDVTGYWTQRFPERKNNNWCFTIAKYSEIIKFLEFIYINDELSLTRKAVQAKICLTDLHQRKERLFQ